MALAAWKAAKAEQEDTVALEVRSEKQSENRSDIRSSGMDVNSDSSKKSFQGTARESVPNSDETTAPPLPLTELLMLAIATSIDALAVGVTFSFLEVNIIKAIVIIGCTTFVLSAAGVFVGNRFGVKYKYRAAIAGGVILILLGIRILVTHLMGG